MANDYQCTSNTIILIAEIDSSHYALELFNKMLKCEQDDRVSAEDVVIQLKTIKQKVIMLKTQTHRGKNRRSDWSRSKFDTNTVSINYVIACRERTKVPSSLFKRDLGFQKNQIVNPTRDRCEWERHGRMLERTPFLVYE